MTKENRGLLSKDLCGRLYYGIKGLHRGQVHFLKTMDWGYDRVSIKVDGYDAWFPVDSFKPYLRLMSSMTEEERKIYMEIGSHLCGEIVAKTMIDWLNAHHFDYRGLIEKGLAIEAPEGMYK